jgi:epoxyqueuosine reductase
MEIDFFQKELLTEIEKQDVDFIYFVDISHLTDIQNKGYSTAILFGIALSKDYLEKVSANPDYVEQMKINKTIKNDEFHLTELKTDKIADNIEKYIVSKGFKAYSQSEENILKTGYYDKENRKTPLPHKTIAGLAGLGWIGKHNLLVTEKYGSAISMCSVLTNAPLDSKRQEPSIPLCGNCNICRDICKTNAIKGKTWYCGIEREKIIDVFQCTTCLQCIVQCPWTKKYMNKNEKAHTHNNVYTK